MKYKIVRHNANLRYVVYKQYMRRKWYGKKYIDWKVCWKEFYLPAHFDTLTEAEEWIEREKTSYYEKIIE